MLQADTVEVKLTEIQNSGIAIGYRVGALRKDLEPAFMSKLAFAIARPSDERLVQAQNIEEARNRVEVITQNFRRLFGK